MKIINQEFYLISENKKHLFTINMILKELETSFNLVMNANIKLRIAEKLYTKSLNEYRIIKNYYNRKIQENILLINSFHNLLKKYKFNKPILELNLELKNIKFKKFIEIILNPLIKKDIYFIMNVIDTINKKNIYTEKIIKLLTYYKINYKKIVYS